MLAAVKEAPLAFPPRKRLTRGDCIVLETAGQLDYQRFELIDGDLIEKMPKNWPHTFAIAAFQCWLFRAFGPSYFVQEAPTNVSPDDNPTSEPEPDLMVFNRSVFEFTTPKRNPNDLVLVIEVSNTTFRFDKTVKAALYARAGIVEYWVLDINGRKLGVHRDPEDGEYRSIAWYDEQESVAPLAAPDSAFQISSAFPAAAPQR